MKVTSATTYGRDGSAVAITLHGRVTPGLRGRTIYLKTRQYPSGTWAIAGRATVKANGTFALRVTGKNKAVWYFDLARLSIGATRSTKAASAAAPIAVDSFYTC